ncbi:hypothetical protein BYT27DRAFT_7254436 [Phlegmacium glaucopus]|nr:hypothetical protein BYT27DRAFT_7254436 [Phlegmacium glaucopus]
MEKELERQQKTQHLLFDHMRENGLSLKLKLLIRHHRRHQWSYIPFKNSPQQTTIPLTKTPSLASSSAKSVPIVPFNTIVLPVTPHRSISQLSMTFKTASEGDGSKDSPIFIPDDKEYEKLQTLDTM